jgi:2-keto-4-pentenoate hydratase
MTHTLRFICLVVSLAACAHANARCPEYKEIVEYVTAYLNREPAKAFPSVKTLGDAQCAQGAVASELARHQGTLAGFRAGFTHKRMQETYKIEGPLRAFLFKKMFLDDGASVDAAYGSRPWFEANLIAVVKDDALQDAKTPLEALTHISNFLPYIELTDLALGADEPLTKPSMLAINVGTRMGVLGAPIAVEASEAFLEKLAAMQVVVTDQTGRELGRGAGRDTLENPINAVLWLARSLSYDGMRILEGDKLSLGALVPAAVPQAGTKITVRYLGMPGEPSVSVSFR